MFITFRGEVKYISSTDYKYVTEKADITLDIEDTIIQDIKWEVIKDEDK